MGRVKIKVVYYAVFITALIALILSSKYEYKLAYEILIVTFGALFDTWVCALFDRDL